MLDRSNPSRHRAPPRCLLIMGVSGVGKSTIGALAAKQLGWQFRDADSFHPPENIAKMSAGTPLNDQDRLPWLVAIGEWLDERLAGDGAAVVTCSALKRSYRDILLVGRPEVGLVFLRGARELIATRMLARKDHFMPLTLLDSQLATLQAPAVAEAALTVDVADAPEAIVATILRALALTPAKTSAHQGTPGF